MIIPIDNRANNKDKFKTKVASSWLPGFDVVIVYGIVSSPSRLLQLNKVVLQELGKWFCTVHGIKEVGCIYM